MDFQPNRKCWNIEGSKGQVCVFCNCCHEDKLERYESRLDVLNERIRKYEQQIQEYERDKRVRPHTAFYNLVCIEKSEDKIEKCKELIRCYTKAVNKLRK